VNAVEGAPLSARIGIATGLVIVGDLIGSGESQERGIAGETPNLAARLQERAEAGTVIVSDRTRRLLGDLFELSKLTPTALKGFTEPVQAWRALGEGHAESRFEALHGARLIPLVGRGEEVELVLSRWRQAKEGGGQVALMSGEPGIGKSRLVLALRERLHDEPKATLSYACSPHHVHSALFPFIVHLERSLGFSPTDSPEGRLNQLELLLRKTMTEPGDASVALFAELLGIPTAKQKAIAGMSPLQKKGLLFRAFLAQLEGLAARGAVLIVLEDAHWLDPTSREKRYGPCPKATMPARRGPEYGRSPRPLLAFRSRQGFHNHGSGMAAPRDGQREPPGLPWLRRRRPASQPAQGRASACHAKHCMWPYRR
jgi:hypothetical protein